MDISDNFKIIEQFDLKPAGKTIIQAFTGSGLVASIVSHHLIENLNMVEKAYISSNLIPAVGIVKDGMIQRPVRIYESDRYILLLSEIGIQEDKLVDFIEYLFTWYSKIDPSNIVIIGALPTGRPNNADDLRYNVVATDDQTKEFLMSKGVWTMPQGAIYGSVALSLMEAKRGGIPSFCILSHCIATVPDYLAAKKVVELLNITLDENIPVTELEEHAENLKEHLQDVADDQDDFDMENFELYDDYDDFDDDDDDDDLSAFI